MEIYKLEIGGGENPLEGYDSLDRIGTNNLTYKFDIEKEFPWPIESNKYNEVIAIHVLEHFNLNKANLIFKEVYRILKPGGIFKVHVPNGEVICNAYLSKKDKTICIFPMYGGETQVEEQYAFAHKILYDEYMLSKIFENSGFKQIENFSNSIIDRHDMFWFEHLNGNISLKISGVK